jgi:cytochrome c peroxidase
MTNLRDKTLCVLVLSLFLNTNTYSQSEIDTKLQELINKLKLTPLELPKQYSRSKIILGRDLFRETKLSGDKNMTCMHCHHPAFGTSDGLPLSIGAGGQGIGSNRVEAKGKIIPRNSPSLINLGYRNITNMFWDGRVEYDPNTDTYQTPEPAFNGENPKRKDITKHLTGALSAQVIFPITSHEEMRGFKGNELAQAKTNLDVWARVMQRLLYGDNKDHYRKLFKEAFPEIKNIRDYNIGHVGHALAAFITRAFTLIDTPYDRYLKGDLNAMTESQKRGLKVFLGRGKCISCHSGEHLSNFQYKSVGTPQVASIGSDMINDQGRFKVTGVKKDLYKFRTPPLRNVAFTAPYMHDGAFESLEEVIEHYNNVKESLYNFDAKDFVQDFYETEIMTDRNELNNKLRFQLISIGPLRRGLKLTDSEKENLLRFLSIGLTHIRE